MKLTKLPFVLPLLAALPLTSCVVPEYAEPGVTTSVGVGYGIYDTLPMNYAGDSYYYGGRYYAGGRYESGRFHDHGRYYSDRYYHNGQYYYGGRHEQHGPSGQMRHEDSRYEQTDYDRDHGLPWQPSSARQPFDTRWVR